MLHWCKCQAKVNINEKIWYYLYEMIQFHTILCNNFYFSYRYFLRVTVVRRLTDMQKELDLLVHTLATYPEMNNPIKMEVGIEECLHIEFEYNKSKYHLKDVIVGKIYFLLVRIKIRYMEVAIIKRETTGSGPNTFHDNETIAK